MRLVRIATVLTLCAFCMTSAAAAGKHVQDDITQALRTEQLPGAVWTLVTPEHGTTIGAAGVANRASGAPMKPNTRVHVGSVTKTVLAMGVLRLVTTGKLSLDTEVAAVLPALRFDNPWQATDPVRVRHLLAHSAGLENFRISQAFSLRAGPDTPLADALRPSSLVVRSRPGERYVYSSTGYQLLGMIIEAVTKRRYERYLDDELLRPLGMNDSSFAFATQAGPHADTRLAMGHFENGVTQPAISQPLRAADQFTTTAADMGRFAAFLIGQGEVDGRSFIAPRLMAMLEGGHGTEAARAGLPVGHGLALATRDRHGVVGACHPGTSVGFRGMLCIYREQRKAFFVAANADVETADYDHLNRILVKALDLSAPQPAPTGLPLPASLAEWDGLYVPAWHAVSSLAWLDTVFNVARVQWDGQRLRFAPLQAKTLALQPVGGGLLRAGGRVQPSHVLLVSGDGERILSDGLRNYRRVSPIGMLGLWASAACGAAGLAWVLCRGAWLLLRRRLRIGHPLALPFAALLALGLPVPFFLTQSFLHLGDFTPASALLALGTCFLPLAATYGVVRLFVTGRAGMRHALSDAAALVALTQWLLVLLAWGMLPVLLWT